MNLFIYSSKDITDVGVMKNRTSFKPTEILKNSSKTFTCILIKQVLLTGK